MAILVKTDIDGPQGMNPNAFDDGLTTVELTSATSVADGLAHNLVQTFFVPNMLGLWSTLIWIDIKWSFLVSKQKLYLHSVSPKRAYP